MATVPEIDYPTSDGRPMAETDIHRDDMYDLIETLKKLFEGHPLVYVSGNLLIFYVPGDKRRHVSPDVFVIFGVPAGQRDNYLVWEEGKGPDFVIELTSPSTRKEDLEDKFVLYRDTLKVGEYFLFDPRGEYLEPSLQGYRLVKGEYRRIRPVQGRLPSRKLGLHLERSGEKLRLYDPALGKWVPTLHESVLQETAARQQAEAGRQQAEAARQQAEAAYRQEAAARQQAETARQEADAEVERLRCEIEALRQRLSI